jgi:hypothetical protein
MKTNPFLIGLGIAFSATCFSFNLLYMFHAKSDAWFSFHWILVLFSFVFGIFLLSQLKKA